MEGTYDIPSKNPYATQPQRDLGVHIKTNTINRGDFGHQWLRTSKEKFIWFILLSLIKSTASVFQEYFHIFWSNISTIRTTTICLTIYSRVWERLWEKSLKKTEIIWNAWKDVLLNTLKVWKWGLWKEQKKSEIRLKSELSHPCIIMLSYNISCAFFWNLNTKSINFEVVKLSWFGGKRTIKSHIHRFNNKRACLVKYLNLAKISHRQYNFESWKQYYLGKPCIHVCLGVAKSPQSFHRGDFGFEGSITIDISECNNHAWVEYVHLKSRPKVFSSYAYQIRISMIWRTHKIPYFESWL